MNAVMMYRDGCGSHEKDGINRSPQKNVWPKFLDSAEFAAGHKNQSIALNNNLSNVQNIQITQLDLRPLSTPNKNHSSLLIPKVFR